MSAVLQGQSVPVENRPDKYALEAARVEGRKEAEAGAACLAPLKYQDKPGMQAAWLDGFLSAKPKRRARRLTLRDAWPKADEPNSSRSLRNHWQGGQP